MPHVPLPAASPAPSAVMKLSSNAPGGLLRRPGGAVTATPLSPLQQRAMTMPPLPAGEGRASSAPPFRPAASPRCFGEALAASGLRLVSLDGGSSVSFFDGGGTRPSEAETKQSIPSHALHLEQSGDFSASPSAAVSPSSTPAALRGVAGHHPWEATAKAIVELLLPGLDLQGSGTAPSGQLAPADQLNLLQRQRQQRRAAPAAASDGRRNVVEARLLDTRGTQTLRELRSYPVEPFDEAEEEEEEDRGEGDAGHHRRGPPQRSRPSAAGGVPSAPRPGPNPPPTSIPNPPASAPGVPESRSGGDGGAVLPPTRSDMAGDGGNGLAFILRRDRMAPSLSPARTPVSSTGGATAGSRDPASSGNLLQHSSGAAAAATVTPRSSGIGGGGSGRNFLLENKLRAAATTPVRPKSEGGSSRLRSTTPQAATGSGVRSMRLQAGGGMRSTTPQAAAAASGLRTPPRLQPAAGAAASDAAAAAAGLLRGGRSLVMRTSPAVREDPRGRSLSPGMPAAASRPASRPVPSSLAGSAPRVRSLSPGMPAARNGLATSPAAGGGGARGRSLSPGMPAATTRPAPSSLAGTAPRGRSLSPGMPMAAAATSARPAASRGGALVGPSLSPGVPTPAAAALDPSAALGSSAEELQRQRRQRWAALSKRIDVKQLLAMFRQSPPAEPSSWDSSSSPSSAQHKATPTAEPSSWDSSSSSLRDSKTAGPTAAEAAAVRPWDEGGNDTRPEGEAAAAAAVAPAVGTKRAALLVSNPAATQTRTRSPEPPPATLRLSTSGDEPAETETPAAMGQGASPPARAPKRTESLGRPPSPPAALVAARSPGRSPSFSSGRQSTGGYAARFSALQQPQQQQPQEPARESGAGTLPLPSPPLLQQGGSVSLSGASDGGASGEAICDGTSTVFSACMLI